ncbi:hypothetical protein [Pedobacter antarcticus]|uniref:hypothetical protein n=1 Tax=Pedobacter antarcticus TaxID=34086 RepID=UPI001C5899E4|nr:hypothetical protein [Pedobacter antarcticus]
MTENNSKPKFEDFITFYEKAVLPLQKENIGLIRLDGQLKGDTRVTFAYFDYEGKTWRVNADTHIDRLKIAYDEFVKGNDPFQIKYLRDNRKAYLAIKGQPVRNAKLYIYA